MIYYKSFFSLILLLLGQTIDARLPRQSMNEISQKVGCTGANQLVCERIVKRHLIRDIKNCQIDPAHLQQAPELLIKSKKINGRVLGSNSYLGFFPGIYSYEWNVLPNGGINITANVHFINHKSHNQETLKSMQDKLNQAALRWSAFNPYPYPVSFTFNLSKPKVRKDVRATLIEKNTRGPYFLFWTTLWGDKTISHEMGHVMGLDDEYSNTPFPELTYCDRSSIMCASSSGTPFPFHYYLIMRRLLCKI